MEPKLPPWPKGAKIAVLLTVMFESWPEGKGPPYGPMASALREGTLDLQSISWANYGGRTGIWRLLRLFDKFGVKATICANANRSSAFRMQRGNWCARVTRSPDIHIPRACSCPTWAKTKSRR